MGFWDFLDPIADAVTDFIPGGDLIDAALGIGSNPILEATGVGNRIAPQQPAPSLPGGQTTSRNGMPSNVGGCAITLPAQQRATTYCQPGYVAVDMDGDGQTDTCMLKEVARACGYWRPRPKALLTASDRKTLNKATTVMRRVDNVVKQTNSIRGQAKLTKSRPSRR